MSPGKMLSRKDLAPRGWSKRMMTTSLPEPEGPLEVGDGLFPRPVWALSAIEELERGPRGSPPGAHLGWAFRISSGISEGIYKSMVQGDR